jgi:hypothetical protein
MSNVIDFFPGRKESELRQLKKSNFRPGLINFGAIDPSKEIDVVNKNQPSVIDDIINAINKDEEKLRLQRNAENKDHFFLYDMNGRLYEMWSEKSNSIIC